MRICTRPTPTARSARALLHLAEVYRVLQLIELDEANDEVREHLLNQLEDARDELLPLVDPAA